ncbi:amino acid ABC transporter permease [Acuticoccus mangrovi]|uniref:Amino acid ABC transporter permease n=1 Tax=Acuticoccus mangrovi TaxID=2796142 RepID=A0A934III2_9HYPH|nr:amino acid ABC transporter permease [Acuticoccus mangrovi]MBJ3777108.1 amino acid ABC transporter permease [Acuticoccus mangrovi]
MNYEFHWPVLWEYRDLLLEGFWITMFLFVTGVLSSLVLGIVFGILGASHLRWARALGEIYVEVFRNTPLVVKMFFLYFGAGFDAYESAIIGLGLHQSAYLAEIFRSGIQAIPRGQFEAGFATGLTRTQVMRRIILPQAGFIVIPPTTTQVLETLKNTSVAMTISIPELTFQTQQIEAYSFRGFEAATAATLAYLAVGGIVGAGAYILEHRLNRKTKSRVTKDMTAMANVTAAA